MSIDEDEKPLDPAVERVRRKLMRLLLVSTGIMVLGFAAVAIAVVYRISATKTTTSADVALPIAAGDIAGVALGDGTIALTIRGDTPRIEVRRLADGALVTTFRLE